jgi:hypothetical protein
LFIFIFSAYCLANLKRLVTIVNFKQLQVKL